MNIPVIWIVIGIAMIIAEIFTPGFFLASIGLGAIAAGLIAFISDSLIIQLLVFAAVSALSLIFLRPVITRLSSKDKEKSGNDAIIGSEGIVLEDIDNIEGKGRVKVNGQDWKAKSMRGSAIEKGTVIIVEKIEGVTLYVERR